LKSGWKSEAVKCKIEMLIVQMKTTILGVRFIKLYWKQKILTSDFKLNYCYKIIVVSIWKFF